MTNMVWAARQGSTGIADVHRGAGEYRHRSSGIFRLIAGFSAGAVEASLRLSMDEPGATFDEWALWP
jgi:hypothetical protein